MGVNFFSRKIGHEGVGGSEGFVSVDAKNPDLHFLIFPLYKYHHHPHHHHIRHLLIIIHICHMRNARGLRELLLDCTRTPVMIHRPPDSLQSEKHLNI